MVFEYNAHLQKEYRMNHEYLYLFLEIFFGSVVLLQADGGIGVTSEITASRQNELVGRNKPFITIPNGITVSSIPLRSSPPFVPGRKIVMICVANFNSWHGIDRLIHGLAQFSGKNSVTLHLVGGGPDIPLLKNLCSKNNLSNRVIFHGFLSGPALDRLFDESHIAVGALGIHRKGLSESSALKTREYCSRGIPSILSGTDPDFPNDFPYVMLLPGNETAVDMELVMQFLTRVYQDPGHPHKMRGYAEAHLDWSIKMAALKNFLEERVIKKG